MAEKYVYLFSESNLSMKNLLGGKGSNLGEMTKIGLNVPPGFTLTTLACNHYRSSERKFPEGLWDEVLESVKVLEEKTGKKLGDVSDPLLLSVRSGAVVSMPGMMDTVLNLGLNNDTLEGLALKTKNRRFALDSYRRLIQMFGDVVLNIDIDHFENALSEKKKSVGTAFDVDLKEHDLEDLINSYLEIVEKEHGRTFPPDPYVQLKMAIKAVFDSWDNQRAKTYRKINDISDDLGTAVNIQTMVFGNSGERSGTGVAFTRNPSTGIKEYFGEFLINAQGEDVVAGIRTPKPISELETVLPKVFEELKGVYHTLENHYKDIQDFEFTIEDEVIFILQTRTAKRTAQAAIKIAVDMVAEGLIEKNDAILRIDPDQIGNILHRRIKPGTHTDQIGSGIEASPGTAVGKVVFCADDAVEWNERGESVILVREETKPDDIHGFYCSEGILTARGGKTSHAAVVARAMGKPCISGCENMVLDMNSKFFTMGDVKIKEGDFITIDGSKGNVIQGEVLTIAPELSKEAEQLLKWTDDIRRLEVWANVSTPEEARTALKFGAVGIGLCRTERMFNNKDRLPIVLEMIVAENKKERMNAIERLGPFQKNDFIDLFNIMEGRPVVIRLLDIPLHEFLPTEHELDLEIQNLTKLIDWLKSMASLSKALELVEIPGKDTILKQLSKETSLLYDAHAVRNILNKRKILRQKVLKLFEVNPMLGHRGVRLGITYPEIYRMQMRAICEAAATLIKDGRSIMPHIMIPQVCTTDELKWAKEQLLSEKAAVEEELQIEIPIVFGTMIEVVRACMRAGRIAEHADFFSFGTNDLTQAVFSFSREDAENTFLPLYNKIQILKNNPFSILDHKGVGQLMDITIEWARKVKPNLKIGVCGEHGGEPSSIGFLHTLDIDYVSCSPYRITVARFAAGQATLKTREELSLIGHRC